ncbi:MAG TPA: helix-turn-helix domain-containing protein [Oligoflexia bacterium]|nr:helix-turn-helix domain-containing protein [Oligoflexia bacterium]
MKKTKGVSLETVIERQIKKDKDFRILFDERRFYLQVAHLITNLRAKSGLSQSEVAKAAGVSQPLIARLEKGDQRRAPTFDTIYRILKTLGYQLEISVTRDHRKAA